MAAGRTDAGVHAAGQVVHFDCCGTIPPQQWASALNGRLPNSIRVLESFNCPCNWHACFSAKSRRYRYNIYNARKPNIFLNNWTWHKYQYKLDERVMQSALQGMIGYHDFSAFQRARSARKDAYTTIQDCLIVRQGDLVQIEVQASGFLYGMVRLMVGQLVALGEHKLELDKFEQRWKECKREEIKESAPAKGLCFLTAGYEDKFISISNCANNYPSFFIDSIDPPPDPPTI